VANDPAPEGQLLQAVLCGGEESVQEQETIQQRQKAMQKQEKVMQKWEKAVQRQEKVVQGFSAPSPGH